VDEHERHVRVAGAVGAGEPQREQLLRLGPRRERRRRAHAQRGPGEAARERVVGRRAGAQPRRPPGRERVVGRRAGAQPRRPPAREVLVARDERRVRRERGGLSEALERDRRERLPRAQEEHPGRARGGEGRGGIPGAAAGGLPRRAGRRREHGRRRDRLACQRRARGRRALARRDPHGDPLRRRVAGHGRRREAVHAGLPEEPRLDRRHEGRVAAAGAHPPPRRAQRLGRAHRHQP
jgi:hypothetical protein